MIETANATTTTAHDISVVLAPMIAQIANDHGAVITILALIGVFAIFNTMMRITMPVVEVLGMVFVITPIIIIQSLTTKDKRYSMMHELRDVKDHAAKNPKAVIGFILYILLIVGFVIVISYTSLRFGI
jgi:uncharacterized membrane protein